MARHKVQRPKEVENQEKHPDQNADIADAVDDKRFLGRIRRRLLLKEKADQQVGTEADPFPADKQHQQVVPHDQQQHEEDKEVQVGERTAETLYPPPCRMWNTGE